MENGGISAILFDLDNTLVDTAGAGRLALNQVGVTEYKQWLNEESPDTQITEEMKSVKLNIADTILCFHPQLIWTATKTNIRNVFTIKL